MSQSLSISEVAPLRSTRAGGLPADPRRVLFVCYAFPPVGGAGVQRSTKFVKYLPQNGWMPSVLTVANPSVPAFDESLLADIPVEVMVRRARTLEPGYAVKNSVATGEGRARRGGVRGLVKRAVRGAVKMLLQPDPQVLWSPAAARAGKKLLGEYPHDVILVSGPPFSSFLLGAKLSRAAGVPLILDYRDEWDLSNAYQENKGAGRASLWLQKRMQYRVLRAASAIIATTQSSAQALEKLRDVAGSRAPVHCIYNGYDPVDFPRVRTGATAVGEARERFRLAYVGTLWNLTSIAPVVSAIELLAKNSPELARRLELVVVGRRTEGQQLFLERMKDSPVTLVQRPYLPHDEALELVRGADGLCVLLSDVPGAGRVVPAKVFEYMAARRKILAVAPRGEMWELLAAHPAARIHEPADVAGIAASLTHDLADFCRDGRPQPCEFDAVKHSRPYEARQLAAVLDSAAQTYAE